MPDRGGQARKRLSAWLRREGFHVCHLCGGYIDVHIPAKHPESWTLDEIVPVSKGGSSVDPQNVAEAHWHCNSARGNMDLDEWFTRQAAKRREKPPHSQSW